MIQSLGYILNLALVQDLGLLMSFSWCLFFKCYNLLIDYQISMPSIFSPRIILHQQHCVTFFQGDINKYLFFILLITICSTILCYGFCYYYYKVYTKDHYLFLYHLLYTEEKKQSRKIKEKIKREQEKKKKTFQGTKVYSSSQEYIRYECISYNRTTRI